jgi:hypothetical protein
VSRDIIHGWPEVGVPAGVELEFAQQLTVCGEHPDVQVADEDQDAGAGVAAAQADVM